MKIQLLNLVDNLSTLPGIRGVIHALTRHKFTIFILHRAANEADGIGGYDIDELMSFVDRLQNSGAEVLPLERIIQMIHRGEINPRPAVAFTADDGYHDQAAILGRAFAERRLPLTVFLITDFVDGKLWPWDARIAYAFSETRREKATIQIGRVALEFDLGDAHQRKRARREFQLIAKALKPRQLEQVIDDLATTLGVPIPAAPPEQFSPMTWDEARELERLGIRFAPHTRTHRVVRALSADAVRAELTDSRDRLTAELDAPTNAIAWPIGQANDFSSRDLAIASELGFSAALIVSDGYASFKATESILVLPRSGVSIGDGGQFSFRRARGIRRLLKPVSSGVSETPRVTGPHVLGGLYTLPARRASRRVQLKSAVASAQARLGGYKPLSNGELQPVRRLVFVCSGNICRSPYAEAIALQYGMSAVSCGINANGIASADPIAARIAAARGVDLSEHVSRKLSEMLFEEGDLVLVMQPNHLTPVTECADNRDLAVGLLGSWLDSRKPWIVDPYGLSLSVFLRVFDQIDAAVSRVIDEVDTCRKPSLCSPKAG